MPSIEFVTTTSEQISNRDLIASSDFLNSVKILDDFPSDASTLVSLLSGCPDNDLCNLLAGVIDHLAKCAAEKFLKTASGLPEADVQFQRDKLLKKYLFVGKWMELYESSGLNQNVTLKYLDSCVNSYTIFCSWNGATLPLIMSNQLFVSQIPVLLENMHAQSYIMLLDGLCIVLPKH